MRILILAALCCVLSFPVLAKQTKSEAAATKESGNVVVDPALLTVRDNRDIARIQDYLNQLKNISADFMQIDDGGYEMHGHIFIQRPGKMKVVYDPPNKNFIVADGSTVHIWNDDLQEQTNVDEGSSLAEFILRDPIKLDDEVRIVKFERFPAKLELTLVQASDPSSGSLTFIFEDNPLILRQWRVVDPEGHTIGVNLQNEKTEVTFPSNTFSFVAPSFGRSPKSQLPE